MPSCAATAPSVTNKRRPPPDPSTKGHRRMTSSIPTVRVKRLKPAFARQHHLGPVSAKQVRARIEVEASLARDKQLAELGRRG